MQGVLCWSDGLERLAMSIKNGFESSGEMKNALEALVNVLYLIREDRHQPLRVLEWVEIADAQTERMANAVRGRAYSPVR